MSTILYSPSTNMFFPLSTDKRTLPTDVRIVSIDVYETVKLRGWTSDSDGNPIAFAPPVKSAIEIRENLLDSISNKRWEVMSGGITLANGVKIDTTDASLNRITQTVSNAAAGGFTDDSVVSFKALTGFVPITIGQIRAIGGMIGKFMQLCFDAERKHTEAIASIADDELAMYDINVNWPTGIDAPPTPEPEIPEEPPVDEVPTEEEPTDPPVEEPIDPPVEDPTEPEITE